jgi:hypothetical protein
MTLKASIIILYWRCIMWIIFRLGDLCFQRPQSWNLPKNFGDSRSEKRCRRHGNQMHHHCKLWHERLLNVTGMTGDTGNNDHR